MGPLFDSHAHISDRRYDGCRDELVSRIRDKLAYCMDIGADMQSSRDAVRASEEYDFCYAAVGVHPADVDQLSEEALAELKELAAKPKTVAIGEIGLDYHYDDGLPADVQQYWFRRQLELAIELDKPVVIHSRNAAADTLNMMREAHEQGLRDAIIHCYSYSREIALEYVEMGYYIGFGGVVTYEGQKKVTKALQGIPIERVVLETDCPYLTPLPYREGREPGIDFVRNSSLYLPAVRDKIAELCGRTPEEIEEITWANAHRVYRIPQT